ncbi:Cilia- and flagella-associated protein 46, partial [Cichlidogyrus casuarinus]
MLYSRRMVEAYDSAGILNPIKDQLINKLANVTSKFIQFRIDKLDFRSKRKRSAVNTQSESNNLNSEQSIETGSLKQRDKELIRNLVQVYLIQAETLIALLDAQPSRPSFGQVMRPAPPWNSDTCKTENMSETTDMFHERHKAMALAAEQELRLKSTEWEKYWDWVDVVQNKIVESFILAIDNALITNQPWLLRNIGVSIWNYALPATKSGYVNFLTPLFLKIVESSQVMAQRQMNDIIEDPVWSFKQSCLPIDLYVNFVVIAGHGLIQPWLPKSESFHESQEASRKVSISLNKGQKTMKPAPTNQKSISVHQIPAEGLQDVKNALELALQADNHITRRILQTGDSRAVTASNSTLETAEAMSPLFLDGSENSISLCARIRLIELVLICRQLMSPAPLARNLLIADIKVLKESSLELTSEGSTETTKHESEFIVDPVESGRVQAILMNKMLWKSFSDRFSTEWQLVTRKILALSDQAVTHVSKRPSLAASNFKPQLPIFKDCPTANDVFIAMKNSFISGTRGIYGSRKSSGSRGSSSGSKNLDAKSQRLHGMAEISSELELWVNLARIYFIQENWSTVVQLSDLVKSKAFYNRSDQTSEPGRQIAFWSAQLLLLGSLANLQLSVQNKQQSRGASVSPNKVRKGASQEDKIGVHFSDADLFSQCEQGLYNCVKF